MRSIPLCPAVDTREAVYVVVFSMADLLADEAKCLTYVRTRW